MVKFIKRKEKTMQHSKQVPKFFPRKVIPNPNGNVLHGLRNDDNQFVRFGEIYVSKLNKGVVKGWKKHLNATLNLIVTHGTVRFVALAESGMNNDRIEKCLDVCIGEENHGLLVIPPGFWLAFGASQGEGASIVNISTEIHDPKEAQNTDFRYFGEYWRIQDTK